MTNPSREDKIGWLPDIRRLRSLNYDNRPLDCEVELVVLHAISLPPEEFGDGYIEDFFSNSLNFDVHPYFDTLRGVKVSPHFFIDREGLVTQFVELNKRAWHAGQSSWHGRRCCNDFSIGIELEGCDRLPFESVQYDSLALLLTRVFALYPMIGTDTVVGHSDIAPGRKTDPGPLFDWTFLKKKIVDFTG